MLELQKRLQRYLNLNQNGVDFNEEIKQVKKAVSVLAEMKIKGVILRSRESEIEECTRNFLKENYDQGGKWEHNRSNG